MERLWRDSGEILERFWRDSAEQFRHIRHHSAINPPPFRHTLKKPRSWRNYDGIGGDSEEISSLYDGFLLNNSAINPPHFAKHSKNRGCGGYGGMVERCWRNYSREQHFPKAKRYAIISPDLEAV